MSDNLKVPEVEQLTYINVPPERVYQTLTTGEGWDAWFTDGTTVDPKPGGTIRFRWKNFGAGRWTIEDGGPVLAVEPNRKFVFQWHSGSVPTTISVELEKRGPGTFLRLTESGYPPTPEDLKTCVGSAAGWGEAMTLLKFYLEHGVTYGEAPPSPEEDEAEEGEAPADEEES